MARVGPHAHELRFRAEERWVPCGRHFCRNTVRPGSLLAVAASENSRHHLYGIRAYLPAVLINSLDHSRFFIRPLGDAQVRNAAEDLQNRAVESVPGRDTQDPQATSETGVNKGFETARHMAEKTEDV
jgi:hypothetical protein